MDIFLLLFTNLIPLYMLIALGWVAGRYFEVDRKTLGALGIYILMPIMAFGYIVQLYFEPSYIALPVLVFFMFSLFITGVYWIARKIYPDNRANLLAMCASSGNTGYFGLPLVLLLFEPEWVAVYIFAMMGVSVYEATIMYYIANRGQFDVRQSLIKLAKFPTIYAIILALFFNLGDIELPEQFFTYWEYFKGAYVIIGMMIIGASLAKAQKLVIAPKFLSLTILGKFIVWPLAAYGLCYLDWTFLHWFSDDIYRLIFVMAVVPPAANIAAFAAQLDMKPEKAATTVLVGTIIALFSIPLSLALSGLFN